MITIALSTSIRAERLSVWESLVTPREILRWNRSLVSAGEVPARYPRPGQHVRWRGRRGRIPVMLHDRPLEVVAGRRLRTALALGLFRFDLTLNLDASEPAGGARTPPHPRDPDPRTRVSAVLTVRNVIPVVGGALDRFAVRKLATRIVASLLEDLRQGVEGPAHRGSDASLGPAPTQGSSESRPMSAWR